MTPPAPKCPVCHGCGYIVEGPRDGWQRFVCSHCGGDGRDPQTDEETTDD